MKKILLLSTIIFIAVGCNNNAPTTKTDSVTNPIAQQEITKPDTQKTVDFSQLQSIYALTGTIPSTWKVEYIKTIEAINIFNPDLPGTTLEQSQIFIRYFTANKFLTLSTVNILQREELNILGHSAIKYEIKKKDGVANFANQPIWRNQQHIVVDIRSTDNNPTTFYVFAKNPNLPEETFNTFLNNLQFK